MRTRRRRPPARRRGLMRLGVLLAVVVLVVLVLLLTLTGDDGPAPAAEGSAAEGAAEETAAAEPAGDQDLAVGETAQLGEVSVSATALMSADQPLRSDRTLEAGAVPQLAEGESFYQAMVYMRNGGTSPVRVDPRDFSMATDDAALALVPTASGPPPRTLLPGASLDLIITFAGPAGVEPTLVYRPPFADSTVRFSGTRSPAGLEGSGS